MKKLFISLLVAPLFMVGLSSCGNKESKRQLTFKESEYQIHSGDYVTVTQKYSGIRYAFAGEVPFETNLDSKTGQITFSENTPNYSQVILTASFEDLQSDQAIVTLLQNEVTTELSFHNPIDNIIDGDYILVSSLNNTAITYALENPVTGVSIDSMSGRVSYTSAAVEGSIFSVVATSANAMIKKNFVVTVNNLATSKTPVQTIEIDSNAPATYVLDFSNVPSGHEEGVIALMNDKNYADESEYSYDKTLHTLVVNSSFINTFKTGENTLRIITSRNIITVKLVLVTKFIRNAHDLQSINNNRESLGGYYVLENDIDLTNYLAKGGEGYNDNRGWNQIGIYHDLEEDPTRDSFTGTFDGNGHIISGYFEERADDLAHNEGLFGYITNQGVVKNVGFVGSETHKTTGRNFIGGFVGFNEGTIKNCWVNVNISNKHEDKIFHSIGAFCGANTGIIDSCYTLGEATGDTLVGAFCGKNYGEITNCYSLNATNPDFCATQITGFNTDCKIFTTLAEMKQFDYSSHFDNSVWEFNANELPTLKHLIDVDYANGIEIANLEKSVFKGDVVTLDIVIHPNNLQDKYINDVQYSMTPAEGSGIVQNNNIYDTSSAVVDEFTVIAVLDAEYGTYTAAKTFKIKEKPIAINLIDDLPTYVEPGKQYEFNVEVTPSTADPEMTWEVLETIDPDNPNRKLKPGRFSFFTGNVLTIEESMMNFRTKEEHPTFSVRGTSSNGLSVTKELTLRRIHYLSENYTNAQPEDNVTDRVLCYYEGNEETTINFTLPSSAELVGMRVYRFSNLVSGVTRTGRTIKIPMKYITDIPNRQIPFTFRCGNGNSEVIYRGYACYINHKSPCRKKSSAQSQRIPRFQNSVLRWRSSF